MSSDVIPPENSDDTGLANIVYILYLAALITGIAGIAGVIIAYLKKDQGPEWLRTHYQFQIRTFWYGLIIAIIGGILTWVLIGFLILGLLYIWLIVRCILGLMMIHRRQAHPNPTTWLFS